MIIACSNMEDSGGLGGSCFGGVVGTKISLDWLQKRGEERKGKEQFHSRIIVKIKEAMAEWVCLLREIVQVRFHGHGTPGGKSEFAGKRIKFY